MEEVINPQVTTIDGWRYTFSGLGEYVLLRTTSRNIEFQGRDAFASVTKTAWRSVITYKHKYIIVEIC